MNGIFERVLSVVFLMLIAAAAFLSLNQPPLVSAAGCTCTSSTLCPASSGKKACPSVCVGSGNSWTCE